MSFERTNSIEYQERSMWSLFQRKHGKRREISPQNNISSIKCIVDGTNPPNPAIRPLLVRPQARDESGVISKEKIKCNVEGMNINTSRCNTLRSNMNSTFILNETKDDEYIKWKNFIFAYAQDAYDLSNPPCPPTKLRMRYFVPPRPFNETERVAALRRYDILPKYNNSARRSHYSSVSNLSNCKNEDIERLQRLVVAALDFFSTSIALISLIDENRCYFKCEVGLNMSDIDRDITFCTHTLLSSEPVVILDASKDWRFKGTISVIDSNARLFFNPQDIRRLSQFARMAMDEIEHLSHVVKHKSSLEANTQGFSLKSSPGFSDIDSASTINEYQIALNVKDNIGNSIQKSIPESVFQDIDTTSEVKLNQNIGKDYSYLQARKVCDFENFSTFPMKMLDSKIDDKQQSKNNSKFSLQSSPLSQIKSNKEQKPGLHSTLVFDGKANFSQNSLNTMKNGAYENNYVESKHVLSNVDKKENLQVLKSLELTPPSTPVNSKTNFINHADKNNLSKEDSMVNLQACSFTSQPSVFATHVIACTLGLDLVYIVQISPDNSASLDSQKNKNTHNSVSLDIVASCGLPYPPPVLDPVLHLRALRSESGLIYRNPFHLDEDCTDYRIGILVPLWRNDINGSSTENSIKDLYAKSCSGVVLAGFSKNERKDKGFSPNEVQYLRRFGGVLEKVLKSSNIKQ
ncbi:hypothetical protein PMAC_000239 [Pneumocystis sp. 'macacae']|nr:hypothetical protein PMAC_000239 [Pneumocystis sp. 'macacae']